MTVHPLHPPAANGFNSANRWLQLVLGIVCMAMIANLQYGWTLFVNPLDQKYHWGKAAIQTAFFIFVLTETWLVPIEGYLVDRFGPKVIVKVGGLLVGIAWVMNSFASSLAVLYIAAAIGGIGAGAVYGTCIGNALKWFPDRRGLAAGLTAAGFGMGSALTIIPISALINSSGYETAFLNFGLGQGFVVFMCSFFLLSPEKDDVPFAAKVVQSKINFTWQEMARTPVFWLMYLMFVLMAAGGLVATAQLGPIAKDFNIANIPVSILGITLPALTFALSIDRVFNGFTRPFFGWVSDHIGRENTMFIAFSLEALGIVTLFHVGHDPFWFVALSGLVFFGWGEIYSLFPSTCVDTFGSKFATTNSGLLYTAKGTAALLVPFSSLLVQATGSWHAVFYVAAAMNLTAALLALLVLKPMRARMANLRLAEVGNSDVDYSIAEKSTATN
jgi:OFA family oxalate/formate antiporter-like MFS transporter